MGPPRSRTLAALCPQRPALPLPLLPGLSGGLLQPPDAAGQGEGRGGLWGPGPCPGQPHAEPPLCPQDQLLREKAQQHDETYYLWATAFFMAFNRSRGFRPELVSETVGVRAFHFIEQNLTTYYEMALMDKKEAVTWARRWGAASPPCCRDPPPRAVP